MSNRPSGSPAAPGVDAINASNGRLDEKMAIISNSFNAALGRSDPLALLFALYAESPTLGTITHPATLTASLVAALNNSYRIVNPNMLNMTADLVAWTMMTSNAILVPPCITVVTYNGPEMEIPDEEDLAACALLAKNLANHRYSLSSAQLVVPTPQLDGGRTMDQATDQEKKAYHKRLESCTLARIYAASASSLNEQFTAFKEKGDDLVGLSRSFKEHLAFGCGPVMPVTRFESVRPPMFKLPHTTDPAYKAKEPYNDKLICSRVQPKNIFDLIFTYNIPKETALNIPKECVQRGAFIDIIDEGKTYICSVSLLTALVLYVFNAQSTYTKPFVVVNPLDGSIIPTTSFKTFLGASKNDKGRIVSDITSSDLPEGAIKVTIVDGNSQSEL